MKREWKCPDSEINFFLYTPERPFKQWVDVRKPKLLDVYGWNPMRKNVMIIHGLSIQEGLQRVHGGLVCVDQ
ncbi:putative Ves G 1 allergen, partial [Operophtera brumata]